MTRRHAARADVLVDARWIGIGGPGRVAEHLLRGLRELTPEGAFVVWGPGDVEALLWQGASRVPSRHHPKQWYSQREFPGPRGTARTAFFAHHLRPAWRLAPIEVTTVHDTIPFRYPPVAALAPAMRAYITWMARHATLVTTDSEFSKQSLVADCRVDPDRIAVMRLPIDHDAAARVRARRTGTTPEPRVVFVGRDAPHKNLDRLVVAWSRTELAAGGGVLTLAGVDGPAVDRLRGLAERHAARVDLPGVVSQDALDDLLARAALLVQPSLEEGFGLPVAEAMAAGIPVAVSTGGALAEIVRDAPVVSFDPRDTDAITAAIDRVAASPTAPQVEWPRPVDFARSVLDAIERARAIGR